jgi:LAO/AO transport system kinase
VGQSELEVDGMTDLNLLLMIPGAGDELQGIKRGIMESADVIVLTKAASAFHDGPDAGKYLGTRNALRNAIGFLPPRENGLRPQVLLTDALSGDGIDALLQLVLDRSVQDSRTGYVAHRRQQQNVQWMHHALRQGLMESLQADPRMKAALADVEDRVRDGLQSPFGAASDLLEAFRTGGVHLP